MWVLIFIQKMQRIIFLLLFGVYSIQKVKGQRPTIILPKRGDVRLADPSQISYPSPNWQVVDRIIAEHFRRQNLYGQGGGGGGFQSGSGSKFGGKTDFEKYYTSLWLDDVWYFIIVL